MRQKQRPRFICSKCKERKRGVEKVINLKLAKQYPYLCDDCRIDAAREYICS